MNIIVGVDEVGRGCWAGPLVAGAVVLGQPIMGLRDSKKLTKSRREVLSEIIRKEALAVGLGWVWPEAIDSRGITQAVNSAMHAALAQITVAYDEVIIDGNYDYLSAFCRVRPCKVTALTGADDLVMEVSAASIIAKVARDNYMAEMAQRFPQYGFEKHVGYGTPLHTAMLKTYGVTPLHRLSYKPIKAFARRTV